MTTSKSPKPSENSVSKVLDLLPDKILQLLPIRFAARTSVLSKKWQSNWLSLNRLVFDMEFFENLGADWQESSNIINSILFHHDGPIHEFSFSIPPAANDKCMNHIGHWLSFVSKNQVRSIHICNLINPMPITSHIYRCSNLTRLQLYNLTLHPPPSGFSGFPKLEHLVLNAIEFSQEDIFCRLIAKSCELATLTLNHCTGLGNIVIDLPSLERLQIFIMWECEPIVFKRVSNLKSVAVCFDKLLGESPTVKRIKAFNNLASSCQLRFFAFEFLCAASLKIPHPLPIAFNYLTRLVLHSVTFSDPDILQNIFGMVESCPFMKELVISIHRSNNAVHQTLNCTKAYKSAHLREVKITGMTESGAEIELIKYLLTVAVALERLFYMGTSCDSISQLKLSDVLTGIPRASPEARIIRLR